MLNSNALHAAIQPDVRRGLGVHHSSGVHGRHSGAVRGSQGLGPPHGSGGPSALLDLHLLRPGVLGGHLLHPASPGLPGPSSAMPFSHVPPFTIA